MADAIEPITIEGDAITASLLVWRRFKAPMPGLVERICALNPGLARQGPFLPVGTVVLVPIPAPRPFAEVTPVRLWE